MRCQKGTSPTSAKNNLHANKFNVFLQVLFLREVSMTYVNLILLFNFLGFRQFNCLDFLLCLSWDTYLINKRNQILIYCDCMIFGDRKACRLISLEKTVYLLFFLSLRMITNYKALLHECLAKSFQKRLKIRMKWHREVRL